MKSIFLQSLFPFFCISVAANTCDETSTEKTLLFNSQGLWFDSYMCQTSSHIVCYFVEESDAIDSGSDGGSDGDGDGGAIDSGSDGGSDDDRT